MSGASEGNQDFHEQLRLQQLYGEEQQDGAPPRTYTDPEDGTLYDWDHHRKAWFPKITEDFMAAYQANYGFTGDGAAALSSGNPPENPTEKTSSTSVSASTPSSASSSSAAAEEEEEDSGNSKEEKKKGEKRKAEAGWFDIEQDKNTNVYVSGLPPDISLEEFVEVMSKCGIIMRDPLTEEYKIKLYKDAEGNLKGDGLCCYLKRESVALAERLLDEYEIRGYRLHVEAAHFELKGQYDASKKKKKNKEYRKRLQQQQKQLDWRPEKKSEVRKRHERVVIIRNMFHPTDFEEDPLELNEYREDLRTECEKFGEVKKVILFDRHPEGVASVAFKEPDEADKCVSTLNGRWFGGRQLSAELWDGVTDYQVEETVKEREERLKGWASFLGDAKTNEKRSKENTQTMKPGQKAVQEKTKQKEEEKEEVEEKEREEEKEEEKEREEEKEEEKEREEEKEEAGVDSTDSSMVGSDDES